MSEHREAIALLYEGGEQAPTITAKGEGELAERIIELAMDHEVPIYENADLASMLTRMELGDQIPEALYRTIAEIIAFAWHLQGKMPAGFVPPDEES
ncbi:EscU/YscU/HrcU family type III secretion system export apparatus switch protein [Halopseudomonas sp. SMJS2]|uniref:EscU/YscU/HrcU family type III secretion system export apparatus switch protein n=1 Tax=Halopseudomonas sp. SMJS2 TaxID=3041098 RepID=UPI002452D103|nr:EscU/YscU/HrcU family type III secretion system export apparatus switch protein [Halopseudomonas sp. SMJS2]WGK62769.1 EscU/YscU/HrcU family type III secretion system export apparatus switch protein [Halopseudomonas sp. SMJS2]